MSNYRDERDALRARSEGLEQELEAQRREVDALRAEGPTEERLERLARDLAAAQVEITKLRGQMRPRPSRAPAAGAAAALALIASGGAAFLVARGRAAPLPPFRAVDVTPVIAVPPVPPIPSPRPPPEAPVAPQKAAQARRSVKTAWAATVKTAQGATLSVGTPCRISAELSADEKTHVESLTVVCGTQPLYSTADKFNGMSSTGWDVQEEAAASGGFVRVLHYRDEGDRQGRNQVSIDTSAKVARVWGGSATPMTLTLTVDELDAPQPEPLFEKRAEPPACKRVATTAKVIDVTGDAGVTRGAACDVRLRPNADKCQVLVQCGERALYANGVADVKGDAIVDDAFSVDDQDPKLRISGRVVEVSDAAITSWSVKLETARDLK